MAEEDPTEVFVKGRGRITVSPGEQLYLKRIMEIRSTDPAVQRQLERMPVEKAGNVPGSVTVIPGIDLLCRIKAHFPKAHLHSLGEMDVIVVVAGTRAMGGVRLLLLAGVCLLLFVGSGLAVISFHHDVNMAATHQALYTAVTGHSVSRPLVMQIPYSLGLGLGMILFFNHFRKEGSRGEPSPLDVEMHLYEANLQKYLRDRQEKERGDVVSDE